jgi:hypothetical protein
MNRPPVFVLKANWRSFPIKGNLNDRGWKPLPQNPIHLFFPDNRVYQFSISVYFCENPWLKKEKIRSIRNKSGYGKTKMRIMCAKGLC